MNGQSRLSLSQQRLMLNFSSQGHKLTMPPRIKRQHTAFSLRRRPHLSREARKAEPRICRTMVADHDSSVRIGRWGVIHSTLQRARGEGYLDSIGEKRRCGEWGVLGVWGAKNARVSCRGPCYE